MDEKKYSVDSTGPSIEDFLDMVFDHLDFDVEYEILEGQHLHPDLEDPDLLVKFTGADVDLLLANKAELMLAVEFLTMEALRMPAEHHSRLCFDANDYRMLRIEELRLSAVTAAEKVKQTRRPFHFNPMNSRERRIIHIALRNETELRSESSGAGPYRGVIVYPAGMPSLPEAPPPPFRPSRFGRPPEPPGDRERGGRGGDRGGRGDRGDRGGHGDRGRGPRGPRR